jgi:hypothetical protein
MPQRGHIAVVALVLALTVWLVACGGEGGGGGGRAVSVTPGQPEVVSASELADFAAEAATPVYWVGEHEGAEYELTETTSGRIYVRYLRGGAEAGDPRSKFLTVGTYPVKDGIATLRRVARLVKGAKLKRTRDGALLLIEPSSEESVHLAYPGGNAQIEVYSRVPGQALLLSASGRVREVP